jgi:hypothetical protein
MQAYRIMVTPAFFTIHTLTFVARYEVCRGWGVMPPFRKKARYEVIPMISNVQRLKHQSLCMSMLVNVIYEKKTW